MVGPSVTPQTACELVGEPQISNICFRFLQRGVESPIRAIHPVSWNRMTVRVVNHGIHAVSGWVASTPVVDYYRHTWPPFIPRRLCCHPAPQPPLVPYLVEGASTNTPITSSVITNYFMVLIKLKDKRFPIFHSHASLRFLTYIQLYITTITVHSFVSLTPVFIQSW